MQTSAHAVVGLVTRISIVCGVICSQEPHEERGGPRVELDMTLPYLHFGLNALFMWSCCFV